jgi:hypothetical protein
LVQEKFAANPQTALGRTAGTLLGSAPVPVAVFGVAPKTVFKPSAPGRGVHAASPHAQPHAQQFSNALANSHVEAG